MSIEKQIGARILSPTMMECTFQYTSSVLETIQNIRNVANKSQDAFCEHLIKSPNDAVMEARGYNNAISILGSRGAGKTSVIMTLQAILQLGEDAWRNAWENDDFDITKIKPDDTAGNNVIMPILVPQDFTSGQSLLSWVIMQLCCKGEGIEKEINGECGNYLAKNGPLCRWIPKNKKDFAFDPLRECMNTLIRSFELRYRSDTKRSGSETDQVFEYMDEVKHDATVLLEMLKLISMMADYYRDRFIRLSHSSVIKARYEPLFLFVIDDLDLAPERSQEILNLVLRYLQHPNVVVLCGWNQELFQSHLCVDLLKAQGVLDSKLLDTNLGFDDVFMSRQRKRVAVLDSARRLAMDNLKKAFPPSQRYEIRGLSTTQRAFFPNSTRDDLNWDSASFLPVIDHALSQGKRRNKDDFLKNYHGEYLYVYMRIFDNKARGLINMYRAFLHLEQHLVQWNHQGELDLTAELRSLLNTILYSNTHFVPYMRGIRDLIRIDRIIISDNRNNTVCDFFCAYKSVKTVLNAYQRKGRDNQYEYEVEREYNYFPSLIIDVYILLNFVENMILQLCGLPRYEHGGNEFSEVLNTINPPIYLSNDNLVSAALMAAGIEQFSLFPTNEDFRINLVLLDNYEKEGFSDQNYDFSGFYGYRRLLRAVDKLTLYCIKNKDSAKRRTEWLRSRAREWVDMMTRIFDALTYSEEHVMRLSKYRSLKRQGLHKYNSELLQEASLTDTDAFEKLLKQKDNYKLDKISDELFESIIFCVRETWSIRRQFLTSLESDKRDTLEGNIVRQKADRFIRDCRISKDDVSLDLSKYRKQLDAYRRSTFYKTKELNMQNIEEAVEIANHNIECLLEFLKDNLTGAFICNLPDEEIPTLQFEYLLNASKAISYYKDSWNLGFGYWSDTESNAVSAIVTMFHKYRLQSQINDVIDLGNLGKNLNKRGRQEYNLRLDELKSWIGDNRRMFSYSDRNELTLNIGILEKAPKNIRRDMDTEDGIYSVLMEVGSLIAQGCALIGLAPEVLEDKTSGERLNTSWPIVERARDEIHRLAEPFVSLSDNRQYSESTQFNFR
jgi:hypothetical protein